MRTVVDSPRPCFLLVLVAAALCLLAVPGQAASPAGPSEVVSETVNQVLVVLREPGLSAEAKRARIEGIVEERFDFETLSRLVLARNWAQLTPEQQKRFVTEFRKHLSVTYGRNIDSYRNETVAVLGAREEARGDWSVKTKIVRGGGSDDIFVDYRLRKAADAWQVIDVTIEGVSLVANFRAQLQELMANGSADRMISLLAEKNAAGESILPPDKTKPAASDRSP